jgi:hypothetical protein
MSKAAYFRFLFEPWIGRTAQLGRCSKSERALSIWPRRKWLPRAGSANWQIVLTSAFPLALETSD